MGKLAVILGVPIALLATVASLGVVIVDVREGGPGGHRLILPVPLALAQAAVLAVPAVAGEKVRITDREVVRSAAHARGVLEALASAPDAELVRVEEKDSEVVVRKEGRSLRVHVRGESGEELALELPLHLVLHALPDAHGRIRAAALAGALGSVRFTDLVEVRDGQDHVRISVW